MAKKIRQAQTVSKPKSAKGTEQTLSLAEIKRAPDIQPRAKTDKAAVTEYTERIKAGDKFPRVVVYFDGTIYWLVEGFHRLEAYEQAGRKMIDCLVFDGTKEDAQWVAIQSNKDNGLRRTNEDKAKAAKMTFAHPNGQDLSDRAIADLIGVSPTMVAKYRPKPEPTAKNGQSKPRVGRDGRKIKTAKIGKTKTSKTKPTEKPGVKVGNKTPAPQAEHGVEEYLEAYRNMLVNLPNTLDKFVKHIHDIAGKALKSKDAAAALARILSRTLVISDAEEKLAKKRGTK